MRRFGVEYLIAEAVAIKQRIDEIKSVLVNPVNGRRDLVGKANTSVPFCEAESSKFLFCRRPRSGRHAGFHLLRSARLGGMRETVRPAAALGQADVETRSYAPVSVLRTSIGQRRFGIIPDTLNHSVKAVGALRRQMLGQPQLRESLLGVKGDDFLRRLVGHQVK